MRYHDIAITLNQRPYDLVTDPPRTTVIAETRCGTCQDALTVTMVVLDRDLRAYSEYATRLKTGIIESLLWALAEHEQENHAIPSDE